MSLNMLQPVKKEHSKFYWFRRRVPARYLKYGMPSEIKFSLKTADWDEAVLRCQEENLKLERSWRDNLEGVPPSDLSHMQINALAGEFYAEMVASHRDEPGRPILWEDTLRTLEQRKKPLLSIQPIGVHLRFAFGDEARAFLAHRRLNLVGDKFESFVRAYVTAKEHASRVLLRHSRGDYTPDPEQAKYPPLQLTMPKRPFEALWKEFCEAKKLSASTKKKWRPYFSALMLRVGSTDMNLVTEQHLLDWRDALLATKLSPITVRDGYIAAAKAFFGWSKRAKKLPKDPSAEVVVEASEKHETKMRGFTDKEAAVILSAALAPMGKLMTKENAAARRWVPWVCAYTGARVNEITQLRASDVLNVDGIDCIRITPEAGTVKTLRERVVPLHPHLIEQGFLAYAGKKKGNTPLFYSIERQRNPDRKNPTYTSVGNKLAEWVRDLGIKDLKVAPNHGWRHRFKTAGRKARMDWLILDAIQGHAPRTEGEDYGEVPPDVMLPEILKHPRYDVAVGQLRDRRGDVNRSRVEKRKNAA